MFLLASNPKYIFINYGSSKISETVKEDMCNAQPLLCSAIAVEWFQTQQSNRTAPAGLVQGQDRSRPGMSGSLGSLDPGLDRILGQGAIQSSRTRPE